MKKNAQASRATPKAFTLIELLVVIAVIAILAAIIIPIAGIARANAARKRAQAELAQLELAIDDYHKRGVYPPDNPNPTNSFRNPLFYELTGTFYTNTPPQYFQRIHGGEIIKQSDVQTVFGIGGFINSAYVANPSDNAQLQQADARDFWPRLEPGKYLAVTVNISGNKSFVVLGVPMDGPLMLGNTTTGERINPWRYVSSNPTNNTSSYDLWVDIIVGGKTNRISNWSQDPQVVSY